MSPSRLDHRPRHLAAFWPHQHLRQIFGSIPEPVSVAVHVAGLGGRGHSPLLGGHGGGCDEFGMLHSSESVNAQLQASARMAGGQMTRPASSKERAALLDWLNDQRSHVLGVMKGLPDYVAGWRLHDVREVILHVITQTAVHAGHLDAARELIDGVPGWARMIHLSRATEPEHPEPEPVTA